MKKSESERWYSATFTCGIISPVPSREKQQCAWAMSVCVCILAINFLYTELIWISQHVFPEYSLTSRSRFLSQAPSTVVLLQWGQAPPDSAPLIHPLPVHHLCFCPTGRHFTCSLYIPNAPCGYLLC